MKVSYDPKADAVYITLKGRRVAYTKKIGPDIAIDYSPNGEVHGIEILSASKHVKISRKNAKIELERLKVKAA